MTDTKILTLSYWLIPEESSKTVLFSLITELAETYGTYSFEPHITLCCGKSTVPQAREAVDSLDPAEFRVCAKVDEINHSMELSKTLYLEFEKTAELSALADRFIQNKLIVNNYVFKPHLSLLYKRTTEEELAARTRRLSIPFQACCFNRIKIIHTPGDLTTESDITEWREM